MVEKKYPEYFNSFKMLEAMVQETAADRAMWAGDTLLIHLQEAGQTGLT